MIEKLVKIFNKFIMKTIFKKTSNRVSFLLKTTYYNIKHRKAEAYKNPTYEELKKIEHDLQKIGCILYPLFVDKQDFDNFKRLFKFPDDYHGGKNSGVWEEKLLEHYISYKLLNLDNLDYGSIYLDIASSHSPWVKIIRDVYKEKIKAYAIDLYIPAEYAYYDYYIKMDATNTVFGEESVSAASLQCAFEMFAGDQDIKLIKELYRIKKPKAKTIIVPLYLHTHPCHYCSPEYYRKGFGDIDSKEYIRRDCLGIYCSRKYDAKKLKYRILDLIKSLSMNYKIYVLKNGKEISKEVYMYFILEIEK